MRVWIALSLPFWFWVSVLLFGVLGLCPSLHTHTTLTTRTGLNYFFRDFGRYLLKGPGPSGISAVSPAPLSPPALKRSEFILVYTTRAPCFLFRVKAAACLFSNLPMLMPVAEAVARVSSRPPTGSSNSKTSAPAAISPSFLLLHC